VVRQCGSVASRASAQIQTADSLGRLWPGSTRPQTKPTSPSAVAGVPGSSPGTNDPGKLNHLNESEHEMRPPDARFWDRLGRSPGAVLEKKGTANFATFPCHCLDRNAGQRRARSSTEKLMPVDLLQRQEKAG